jgi:hypothetical protein
VEYVQAQAVEVQVLLEVVGQVQEDKVVLAVMVLLHKLIQQKETLQLIFLAVAVVQVPQLVQIIKHQVEVVAAVKLEIQVIMEQQE